MKKKIIPAPETRAQTKKLIQQFRLIDDDFMRVCLQNNKPAVQLILRIILGKPNLEVQKLETQKEAKSLAGRSVRFDVWARDGDAVYNIEIERTDSRASAKRARYHSSMLDSCLLKSGEDFDKLVETFVIFITENDIFHKGRATYRYDRYCAETGEHLGDEAHIIYVNGQYRGKDRIGALMHDFSCKNASEMVYTELAERVRYFKEDTEGEKKMCKILEEWVRKERQEEAARVGALMSKLLSLGKTDEAMKASSDPVFRDQLYKLYNL